MTTFAYVRASTDKQVMSCDTQVAKIRTAICRIQEDDPDVSVDLVVVRDNAVSGKKPFANRKGGNRILNTVQPDDVIIATRDDRLARHALDLLSTVETLEIKAAKLYVLNFLHGACLTRGATPETRVVMQVFAAFSEFERRMIGERTKEGLAYRKDNGLAYGRPCYGMRRIWRDKDGNEVRQSVANAHRAVTKHDVWDQDECALIREIYRRHQGGEPLYSIAKEFLQRKVKTCRRDNEGNRTLWVTRPDNPKRSYALSTGRVYHAYKWYSKVVAAGYEIGGLSDDKVDLRGMFDRS